MKHICIHGHFYQPPRENPYTEKISMQESANPFHDWNERISHECYGPNAFSRVLNEEKNIINIINNYEYISFNYGPTLLSWLEAHSPLVYTAILEADKKSCQKNNGHGSAIAQVYNHIIMPLANRQDKEVQVKWGIKDFVYRFKRKPEGMWLAETAVDIETLDVLAENDIAFTILSPYQAKAIKKKDYHDFDNVSIATLNTNEPYWVYLPSGKRIAIFFYNGDISQKLAYGDMLNDGKNFATTLKTQLNFNHQEAELVNVAIDGETFGHHHKNGDMALAYCISTLSQDPTLSLCNYGTYLSLYPPEHEIQIHEKTAWSCSHGLGRWTYDCGCSTMDKTWNQQWRTPLRDALNFLNEKANTLFRDILNNKFKNLDVALFDYVDIILLRNKPKAHAFLSDNLKDNNFSESDFCMYMRLFEMKRNCQLMFTSCGWFFNDISGIETVQILLYADRVLQIYLAITNINLENDFANILGQGKSNLPNCENGRKVYQDYVRANRLGLFDMTLSSAINCLFMNESIANNIHINNITNTTHIHKVEKFELGYIKLIVGEMTAESSITYSKSYLSFVIMQLGRANIIGFYSREKNELAFDLLKKDIEQNVTNFNLAVLIDNVKQTLKQSFALNDVTPDEAFKILDQFMKKEESILLNNYEDVYLRNYAICVQYKQSRVKIPYYLWSNIRIIVRKKLLETLKVPLYPSIDEIRKLRQDILFWDKDVKDVLKDSEEIKLQASDKIYKLFEIIIENVKNETPIIYTLQLIQILEALNLLDLNLWRSQNIFLKFIQQEGYVIKHIKNSQASTYEHLKQLSLKIKIDIDYVTEKISTPSVW